MQRSARSREAIARTGAHAGFPGCERFGQRPLSQMCATICGRLRAVFLLDRGRATFQYQMGRV